MTSWAKIAFMPVAPRVGVRFSCDFNIRPKGSVRASGEPREEGAIASLRAPALRAAPLGPLAGGLRPAQEGVTRRGRVPLKAEDEDISRAEGMHRVGARTPAQRRVADLQLRASRRADPGAAPRTAAAGHRRRQRFA